MPPALARFAQTLQRVAPWVVTGCAFLFALRKVDDFDTWWHLASGRWIMENGYVPDTDTLSYTVPENAWINLQWAFDVVLYQVYSAAGANGIVLLAAACFTFAIWLAIANARLFVDGLTASVLVLWALLMAEERFLIRPEMFSFVFLGLILRVLLSARRNEGRLLWALVPLMALWANFHALFIMGTVAIGASIAGAWAATVPFLPEGWREASDVGEQTRKRLSLWGGLALLAPILNPYFHRGLFFPLELMTRIGAEGAVFQSIGEFRSPWSGYFTTVSISAYQGLFFLGIAVVVAAALADAVGRRRRAGETATAPGFDLGAVIVFAGIAYLSCLARRNMGIFAVATPPLLAVCLSGLWARSGDGARKALSGLAAVLAPLVVLVPVALGARVATNAHYLSDGRTHETGLGVLQANYPANAVAFARENGLPGPVYNDLTMGGYLAWDHPTDEGVFIDGRLEVYDADFYSYYQSAFSTRGAWQEQEKKYGFQSAILFHRWGNRHALIRAIAGGGGGWTVVYYDEVAIIIMKQQGNEAALARLNKAFVEERKAVFERLTGPVEGFQAPVSRLVALETFSRLLALIGAGNDVLTIYDRILELDPAPDQELRVRTQYAYRLARMGRREQALMQARKAAEIAPDDQNVTRLLQQLGG